MPTSSSAQSPDKVPYPRTAYAWYVVVILTLAYVVSFLDRQILALLVEPVKADLGASDTQMSLLLGLAFALFYTVFGIPLGRLADRSSRRLIIGAGISVWCLMTALCGLAQNYTQLFLARVGVGVGEATLGPSAMSMISDYFPPHQRAKPLAFYAMGVSVGAGVAMLIGALVIRWVERLPPVVLPLFGQLYSWQIVFLLVGLPGMLIAALVLTTVREPFRQGRATLVAGNDSRHQVTIRRAFLFIVGDWKAYAGIFVGMSGATIMGYGLLSWLPALFVRTWNWDIAQIASVQGMVMLVAGPISANFAGWLADRGYRNGQHDICMRLFVPFSILMLLSAVLLPLMPGPWWAVVLLGFNILGSAGITALASTALMLITPNQLRGQVSAIYFFCISLLGLTVGPTAVALLTDYLFRDEAALRYSLAIVVLVAGIVAVAAPRLTMSAYRLSVRKAEAWVS